MALNREWHLAHKMPRRATTDERIAWHVDHEKACSCREIPARLLEEMARRGLRAPGRKADD